MIKMKLFELHIEKHALCYTYNSDYQSYTKGKFINKINSIARFNDLRSYVARSFVFNIVAKTDYCDIYGWYHFDWHQMTLSQLSEDLGINAEDE